jgi:hypothetical protein
MTHNTVLTLPDFMKTFVAETDTTRLGIVVVLMPEEHPLAYFSKLIAEGKHRLSMYKEFLVIILETGKWFLYLIS